MQTTIDLVKNADKIFTPVFEKVRAPKTRYVVVLGSAGSSKSVSVHQSELINITRSDHNTLFIRKHGSDIRESCYKLLQDIASEWGVSHYFKFLFSTDQRKITYLPTGKSIIFKGIDDPEKLKSIAGIKRIIIEEATQLTFADFLEISRRARGIDDIQIILILNPISENHWIKTKMCDLGSPYRDRTTVLHFTYRDNKFMKPDDIRELEALKLISDNEYRVYVEGEWGVEDTNRKYAYNFIKDKHVKNFAPVLIQKYKVPYNPARVVWLSFDFNVDPMSCTCFQKYSDILFVFKCFKLHNSGTHELCDHIKSYFLPGTVFMVTGDATGQSRNAMSGDEIHNYTIIQKKLNLDIISQMHVPSKNPDIKKNRVLLNAVLKNYEVWIQPGPDYCDPLIYDLTYVEFEDGEILKDRTTEKKKSDFLDTFRYYLNIDFAGYLKDLG